MNGKKIRGNILYIRVILKKMLSDIIMPNTNSNPTQNETKAQQTNPEEANASENPGANKKNANVNVAKAALANAEKRVKIAQNALNQAKNTNNTSALKAELNAAQAGLNAAKAKLNATKAENANQASQATKAENANQNEKNNGPNVQQIVDDIQKEYTKRGFEELTENVLKALYNSHTEEKRSGSKKNYIPGNASTAWRNRK